MAGGFGSMEKLAFDLGLPLGFEIRLSDYAQLALRGRVAIEPRTDDVPIGRFEASLALLGFAPLVP